jgi:hypothetical protein
MSQITNHDLFNKEEYKTYSIGQLTHLIDHDLKYEDFKALEGFDAGEKAEYVWKQIHKQTPIMEKEIIGYNLKEPKFRPLAEVIIPSLLAYETPHLRLQSSIEEIKSYGVLDIWFEPVYKEKFKVGDYLYCITRPFLTATARAGTIYKVVEADTLELENGFRVIGHSDYTSCFRLATKEEIEKSIIRSEVIFIGNPKKEVSINSQGSISCDGYDFSLEALKRVRNRFDLAIDASISGLSIKPTGFQIGCAAGTEIRKEDINKIIESYNKLNVKTI